MANYLVCSAATGSGTGDSWLNAYTNINAVEAVWTDADTVYVHNTHNFTYGATQALSFPITTGMRILCVDGGDAAFTSAGASMGSTIGTLRSGAVESCGAGNFGLSLTGFAYIHGCRLQPNDGASRLGVLQLAASAIDTSITFTDCILSTNSTSATPNISIGASSTGALSQSQVIFNNCTFNFGNAGQSIEMRSSRIAMNECTLSGTAVTSVLESGGTSGTLTASGCDFSTATNVWTSGSDDTPHSLLFSNCKIGTPTAGTHSGPGSEILEFHACAPGSASDYTISYYKQCPEGVVEDDTGVYRTTGGATSDDEGGTATKYSLKMVPSSFCSPIEPLYSPWIYRKVDSTGSKTLTIQVATTTTALTDQNCWAEFEFMGTSGVPTALLAYDADVPVLGTGSRNIIAAGTNRSDLGVDGWTGITSEFEYNLSATVTVNNIGYVRARVAVGVQQTVYVDALLTVA